MSFGTASERPAAMRRDAITMSARSLNESPSMAVSTDEANPVPAGRRALPSLCRRRTGPRRERLSRSMLDRAHRLFGARAISRGRSWSKTIRPVPARASLDRNRSRPRWRRIWTVPSGQPSILRRLGLGSSLHVAEDDGEAVFFGKSIDLIVQFVVVHGFGPAFCVISFGE